MDPKPYIVPVSDLIGKIDPLDGTLWGCARINEEDVKAAVSSESFEERHWDGVKDELHGPGSRDFHVKRVAYFVHNGLTDDGHSIRLIVDGDDPKYKVRIDNGNHRLAAALIREDSNVKVLLYFFDQADVEKYLPGAVLFRAP